MSSSPPSATRRKRVLVVDDDETNRDLARHILQLSRLSVDVAVSGEDALDLIAQAAAEGITYDVIVADLMMPGMSGTDLASELVERGKPPRLVCVTGRVAPTTLEMCAAAGFDVVVTKPYRMASLLLAVMGEGAPSRTMSPRSAVSSKRMLSGTYSL